MKAATSIHFNYLMLALLFIVVTLKGIESGHASYDDSYGMMFLALLDHWFLYFVLPVATGYAIANKQAEIKTDQHHSQESQHASIEKSSHSMRESHS
ncbi:hypothetical protein [Undibacterium sp. RuTC16W]|uniref:hypothetical protein n=1 Tax=Undibacterium sp. RuTC16W TaxID=3413048 RepID=UPI003BF03243